MPAVKRIRLNFKVIVTEIFPVYRRPVLQLRDSEMIRRLCIDTVESPAGFRPQETAPDG